MRPARHHGRKVGIAALFVLAALGTCAPAAEENLRLLVLQPAPRGVYSASSRLSGNYMETYAFDGDRGPRNGLRYWRSARGAASEQWLAADYGRSFALTRFVVHWADPQDAAGFAIQVASDGQDWRPVAETLEADAGGRSEVALPEPVPARHVRLFRAAGSPGERRDSVGVYEFEIYHVRPEEAGLTNRAAEAVVTAHPFAGASLKYVQDGRLDTAFLPGVGEEPLRIRLAFERPVPLAALEFVYTAEDPLRYAVHRDADGDGVFELRGEPREGCPIGANAEPWDSRDPVRAVELELELPSRRGWWTPYPYVHEIRALAPAGASGSDPAVEGGAPSSPPPPAPVLQLGGAVRGFGADAPPSACLLGAYALPFDLGIHPGNLSVQPGHAAQVLSRARAMGLNHLAWEATLNLGNGSYHVPWRSKILLGIEDDSFRDFVAQAQAQGIRVSVILHRNVRSDPDGLFGVADYARDLGCMLSGPRYTAFWKALLQEILVDLGCDGVSVIFDEAYAGLHYGVSVRQGQAAEDDPCFTAFRREAGAGDIPFRDEDTPLGRRYRLFGYRQYARQFADLTAEARRLRPGGFTWCNINKSPMILAARGRTFLAYDLIGAEGDVGYWGTVVGPQYHLGKTRTILHPAWMTKRFAAASRQQECGALISAGYYYNWHYEKPYPASCLSGSALVAAFNGARSLLFYRLNYLRGEWQGRDLEAEVRQLAGMLRTLETFGIESSESPKRIAVLYSRASEDWWQLARDQDANRGFFRHQALCELLLAEGYPYDVLYDSRADHLAQLSAYDLVLLPFPYAISDAAVAALSAAAEAGRQVLFFSRQGETDEYGDPRPAPALPPLRDRWPERVRFDESDLCGRGGDPAYVRTLCAQLDRMLGPARDWVFEKAFRDDVLFFERRIGEDRRVLLLVNHEDRPLTVQAGVTLPSGRYRAEVVTREGVRSAVPAGIPGEGGIPAETLRRFAVPLPAQDALVLCIAPE